MRKLEVKQLIGVCVCVRVHEAIRWKDIEWNALEVPNKNAFYGPKGNQKPINSKQLWTTSELDANRRFYHPPPMLSPCLPLPLSFSLPPSLSLRRGERRFNNKNTKSGIVNEFRMRMPWVIYSKRRHRVLLLLEICYAHLGRTMRWCTGCGCIAFWVPKHNKRNKRISNDVWNDSSIFQAFCLIVSADELA